MSQDEAIWMAIATAWAVIGAVELRHRIRNRRRSSTWRRHVDTALQVLGDRRPQDDLNRRWP